MSGYWYLVIAIVAEVIATSALKASIGFTRLWPSLTVVVGYGVAFYALAIVLKSVPVGVAYATWSGLGNCSETTSAFASHKARESLRLENQISVLYLNVS